jgi:quinol-cytochrome oxidoreductase complex cytochrome b subunit
MPTIKSLGLKLFDWVDDRVQIKALVDYMAHKSVPRHDHEMWYYFGGLSLFFFIVQVCSGILLLLYYRPGADSAYESVQFIISKVQFGWLIRAIHSWSANLMILAVVIHMFSVFFTKAYRKPREITWLTGMGLMGLVLFFGFSGYLLPWNELAFFATKVGTGMAGVVPVAGDFVMKLMRGSDEVTGATITRFFGLHVAVLPAVFTAVLTVHLLLVQRQGMSEPISWETRPEAQKRYMPFFPNFLLRDLLVWLIALNVLAILAVFFPYGIGPLHWDLGLKADPFSSPPAHIRPEWYFMFMFQSLKFLPARILFVDGEVVGILGFGLAAVFWTLIPFFDRATEKGRRKRLFAYIGLLAMMFVLVMTILGYVLD